MQNNKMDKVNKKVLLNYVYTEKLSDLGDNFFGTIGRIQTLRNRRLLFAWINTYRGRWTMPTTSRSTPT